MRKRPPLVRILFGMVVIMMMATTALFTVARTASPQGPHDIWPPT